MKYKNTLNIQTLFHVCSALEGAKNDLCKPVLFFQKQRSIEDIIRIVREYGTVKTDLMREVVKTYPRLKDKNILVNGHEVKVI